MAALEPLHGLVVLDEAQPQPEVFPVLRVLADRDPLPALSGLATPRAMEESPRLGASWEGLVVEEPFVSSASATLTSGPLNPAQNWMFSCS